MSDRLVARRVHDGAAWITLNRPDARNALNLKMLADLRDALGWAADDESVRAVVLTGAGTVFCAGIDLAELDALHRLSVEEVRSRIYGSFQSIAEALVDMPKPVVAAVNGDALGAGLDIALACDIRIASRSARLSEYYVRVGLIPALSGTFLLPRLIGLGRSNLLSMTGDLVSGDEAFRLGLVDVVAEDADFLGAVADHAGRLAAGATVAIGLIKRATRHSWLRDMHAELEYAAGLQAEALQTADHMEAVTAIREQRKPRFTGH